MCGIFALVAEKNDEYPPALLRRTLKTLAELSEARGKDSSGLVFRDSTDKELTVFKGAVPIRFLLSRPEVRTLLQTRSMPADRAKQPTRQRDLLVAMGHARLVTNGTHTNDDNNQPIVKQGIVGIHNGIVVNADELWAKNPHISRQYEIDTEVVLALVRDHLRLGLELSAAVSAALRDVRGTASVGFLFDDQNAFVAATNNGSLYLLTHRQGFVAIASEDYFVRQIAALLRRGQPPEIRQVPPGSGVIVDLEMLSVRQFAMNEPAGDGRGSEQNPPFAIDIRYVAAREPQRELVLDPLKIATSSRAETESHLLEDNTEEILRLLRCTRCVLPSTFPFIDFDAAGVCNYCRNYRLRNQPKPIEELLELVARYRRSGGRPDCVVPFSGGRDSTFTLHIVKNVLKLKPVTVTYDWGMVTDLARRNIARACGKLRVENIIAAADITKKRENIRLNIQAWLRRPDLGMIPLFMAGDKFFYYYVNKIKSQTNIELNIWGINSLENTDFKVGFLGVAPNHAKKRIYSLSSRGKGQLLWGVGRSVVTNPSYLNSSVVDTIGSFLSRYMIAHADYYHLFDYYRWDEKEIEELIVSEYDWETSPDAQSTWRVGDGTAAFYNYVYYTVAGFSEADTFRSNQIREGMMSREEALRRVVAENRPRYPTLRWYLDIVGLDFVSTVERINQIPKLYRAGAEGVRTV